MNHRDRIQTALNHEVPDRCPMQISFTPEFAARLRSELGQAATFALEPVGHDRGCQLERALDEDLLLAPLGWIKSSYVKEENGDPSSPHPDEWGVLWRDVQYQTRFGTGFYANSIPPWRISGLW